MISFRPHAALALWTAPLCCIIEIAIHHTGKERARGRERERGRIMCCENCWQARGTTTVLPLIFSPALCLGRSYGSDCTSRQISPSPSHLLQWPSRSIVVPMKNLSNIDCLQPAD